MTALAQNLRQSLMGSQKIRHQADPKYVAVTHEPIPTTWPSTQWQMPPQWPVWAPWAIQAFQGSYMDWSHSVPSEATAPLSFPSERGSVPGVEVAEAQDTPVGGPSALEKVQDLGTILSSHLVLFSRRSSGWHIHSAGAGRLQSSSGAFVEEGQKPCPTGRGDCEVSPSLGGYTNTLWTSKGGPISE